MTSPLCQRCRVNSIARHYWIVTYRGKRYHSVICDPCHKLIEQRRAELRAWQQGRIA
jgi:hypothetical protein